MVDSLAIGASPDRPRPSVLAITNDSTSCRALAGALRSDGMFALAATPAKACRLTTVFLFDVVVLLGDIRDEQRDQILSAVRLGDSAVEQRIELLDVIDPRIVVQAARRALQPRREGSSQ